MEELLVAALALLTSSHLLISRLHVVSITVLVVTASVTEHLLFIVVLSITQIFIMFLPIPAFRIALLLALACPIEVFLLVVEEIFELLVEQHLISIADSRILIGLLGSRVTYACWPPGLCVVVCRGWRALLRGLWGVCLEFLLGLFQTFEVVVLNDG